MRSASLSPGRLVEVESAEDCRDAEGRSGDRWRRDRGVEHTREFHEVERERKAAGKGGTSQEGEKKERKRGGGWKREGERKRKRGKKGKEEDWVRERVDTGFAWTARLVGKTVGRGRSSTSCPCECMCVGTFVRVRLYERTRTWLDYETLTGI